jgi:hypothetical protein
MKEIKALCGPQVDVKFVGVSVLYDSMETFMNTPKEVDHFTSSFLQSKFPGKNIEEFY